MGKSPLCNNYELQNKLRVISNKIGVSFGLMVGIANAESNIGSKFRNNCGWTHNRAGIKRAKDENDQNTRIQLPHKGCRLYPFKSVEEFRESFAYSLKYGYTYKGCDTPECISKSWVRNDGKIKTAWSSRVRYYMVE